MRLKTYNVDEASEHSCLLDIVSSNEAIVGSIIVWRRIYNGHKVNKRWATAIATVTLPKRKNRTWQGASIQEAIYFLEMLEVPTDIFMEAAKLYGWEDELPEKVA